MTSDRIYCDGTFNTCPSVFHQIYTIHIQIDGIMYPVVYALLPSKSEQVYTRFFNLVQRTMITNNLPFSPTTVLMDFERAAQNAIRSVCHGITIKGCFCHYIQRIWRKAQMTGLQIPYRDNEDIRKLVRRAAALPLVPEHQVEDTWFHCLQDLDDTDLPVDTTPFTDYIIAQWIERDHTVWNHFNTEGPRTTNHIEAWHGKVKKKVQHCHPNIYTIIQAFKDNQASNEIHRLQLQAGGTQRPRPRKNRNIDSRLRLLKQRFTSNHIDLMTYIDQASELLHLG